MSDKGNIVRGVQASEIAGRISDRILRKIAEDLGSEWEKLATFLGFTKAQISNLKSDNPYQTEEQIFNMLIKWRQQRPASIDQFGTLRKELTNIGRQDLADNLLDTPPTEAKSTCQHQEENCFYCETCKVFICRLCTLEDHHESQHSYTESEDAYAKGQQTLNELVEQSKAGIREMDMYLDASSKAKEKCNNGIAQAIKDVKDRALKVMEEVRAEENRMITEIENLHRDRNQTLDEYMRTVKDTTKRKLHYIEAAEVLQKKKSHSDFLKLYPAVKKELRMLNAQCTRAPPIECNQTFLKFKPSQTVGDINLGTVLVQEDTWELRLEFGKEGSGPGEFTTARGIAVAGPDEIAVADWVNNRMVIYDSQGHIKSSIPEPAGDVVRVSDKWVFLTQSTVHVYKNNTRVSEFRTVPRSKVSKTDVYLVSVAVRKNGNIIVGDMKRKVLTEHSSPDWSIIHTIPVEITPNFITVMNNDMIAVSDYLQGRVDLVDVVDSKAVTASTIKPIIGGRPVEHCRGVCSRPNSSGIYLAVGTEYHNMDHIHHYNNKGHFVSCVAQGLYRPAGITFTSDEQQMAVADWHSVKIYHKV